MEQSDGKMSAELAAVLDGLRSEGEVSSSGVFTVDLAKALPKLEKFQLPKPHFGLLKIIQSAVVSGATIVSTSFSTGAITIEHNGIAPTPDDLKRILSYLMAPDFPAHDRALRDLAIGVNTTLARGASWVELSVLDGEEWVSQRWLSREETENIKTPKHGASGMTTRFVMRRTVGQAASRAYKWAKNDLGDIFTKSRDSMDEDSRAIFDRCRHAPAQILLDGRPLPASLFGKVVKRRWGLLRVKEHRRANLLDICLVSDAPSPHLLSPPMGSDAQWKYVIPGVFKDGAWTRTGKPQLFSNLKAVEKKCFAVFGVRNKPSIPGVVTLVKDGVDLTTMAPPLLQKGVTTILSAEGLPLDLSHFRIIDGSDIRERLKWLKFALSGSLQEIMKVSLFNDLSEAELDHLQSLAT